MKRGYKLPEKIDDETQASLLRFFKEVIKACIHEALNEYFENHPSNPKGSGQETEEWLSTEEAKKLLGVKSKSKMQQLRDNGQITFSQHGRIIKYSRNSILEFLKQNVVNIHKPGDLKAAA